ncbi:DeoR family transcriptional regulator [Paenibacillus sp. GSMTC-2017]|uniref:DeoR family transcriptional regulator n=1 Tax=Paenibacillus sp. GSMTC-2017 TaxID=2794350 RepID=UPI0018DA1AC4|nr:DeoR family transcriptional regulator [Paenibacillus sp. GSMTC-2017]MBH5318808.1 DeoR family transcriptional regulator [Paenibacillus sp. GSMTC-2017]
MSNVQTRELVASIRSEKAPLSGQKNRSSGNFSTEVLPTGTKRLLWEVEGGGVDPYDITFNVMRDVSAGTDPVELEGVITGNASRVVSARSLYIANPSGAQSSFVVKVYAIV